MFRDTFLNQPKVFDAMVGMFDFVEEIKDEPTTTAQEAWDKKATKYPGGPKAAYCQGYNHGKEQGRLEMWLELSPLVEAAKELSAMPEFYSTEFDRIVKNLKPLNDETK